MGASASDGAAQMDKIHVSSPEPVVFLKQAAKHLAEHRRSYGTYPAVWPELDMTFVNGPYNMNDPDIRPPPDSGNSWQPKNSRYHYRLLTNTRRDAFRIEAIGPDGRTEYFIQSGQDAPTKVEEKPPSVQPR